MTSFTLPKTFKAVFADRNGKPAYIDEVPLSKPGKNEVLVKMAFAPINPADLLLIEDIFPVGTTGKTRIGLEGSGLISDLGNNLKVPHKLGDRVHVVGLGCWGEYLITNSENCFPMKQDMSFEVAASHCVNPGTVLVLEKAFREGKHKAAVHTAGSSALGRMMIKYFKKKGIKLINIVRKKEYIQSLLSEGADFVLDQTDPDFLSKFQNLAKSENATCCFDAIGGDFTAKMFKNMPQKSEIFVYGALAEGEITGLRSSDFLFSGSSIKGISRTMEMEAMTPSEKVDFFKLGHEHLKDSLSTKIQKVVRLEELQEGIETQEKKGSEGKVLISFGSF